MFFCSNNIQTKTFTTSKYLLGDIYKETVLRIFIFLRPYFWWWRRGRRWRRKGWRWGKLDYLYLKKNRIFSRFLKVSEEIAESELDDDAEDVVEETDETSPVIAEKDNEVESENDLEEQELAEAVADDGSR